jgi:hypothetical protein
MVVPSVCYVVALWTLIAIRGGKRNPLRMVTMTVQLISRLDSKPEAANDTSEVVSVLVRRTMTTAVDLSFMPVEIEPQRVLGVTLVTLEFLLAFVQSHVTLLGKLPIEDAWTDWAFVTLFRVLLGKHNFDPFLWENQLGWLAIGAIWRSNVFVLIQMPLKLFRAGKAAIAFEAGPGIGLIARQFVVRTWPEKLETSSFGVLWRIPNTQLVTGIDGTC